MASNVQNASKQPQHERTRILLASGERATAELFGRIAEEQDLELMLPVTGDEATARLRRDKVALAAIDLTSAGLDGWALYNRLRNDPATSSLPVLLIAKDEDLAGRMNVLRSDLDDYVAPPLNAQAVAYRVRHLLARAQTFRLPEAPRTGGRIIAFCSNKGGVGKTVLAVNTAVALQQRTGKKVVVVDGDLYYGNVGTYLGVPPVRSIVDLIAIIDDIDAAAADRILVRHASGVRALLGPNRPDEGADITASQVQRVLEFLSSSYDYVVVDCQTNIDHRLMPALDLADDIMMIVTPEMGSLRNMRVLMDQLTEAGVDGQKIHIVLNRAATNVEIDAHDIEQAFQQKVEFSLGSGGRPMILSVNRGVPLILEQPRHPVSQAIMEMAEHLSPEAAAKAGGPARK